MCYSLSFEPLEAGKRVTDNLTSLTCRMAGTQSHFASEQPGPSGDGHSHSRSGFAGAKAAGRVKGKGKVAGKSKAAGKGRPSKPSDKDAEHRQ